MSGGSFNYICWNIENELVGQMEDKELNELMKDIAGLTHDLEWYKSGDIGKDDYFETVKKFKKKWFQESRSERLKKYIETSIEEFKKELCALVGEENDD